MEGDVRCLIAGHVARQAINRLHGDWDFDAPLSAKMAMAEQTLRFVAATVDLEALLTGLQAYNRRKEALHDATV